MKFKNFILGLFLGLGTMGITGKAKGEITPVNILKKNKWVVDENVAWPEGLEKTTEYSLEDTLEKYEGNPTIMLNTSIIPFNFRLYSDPWLWIDIAQEINKKPSDLCSLVVAEKYKYIDGDESKSYHASIALATKRIKESTKGMEEANKKMKEVDYVVYVTLGSSWDEWEPPQGWKEFFERMPQEGVWIKKIRNLKEDLSDISDSKVFKYFYLICDGRKNLEIWNGQKVNFLPKLYAYADYNLAIDSLSVNGNIVGETTNINVNVHNNGKKELTEKLELKVLRENNEEFKETSFITLKSDERKTLDYSFVPREEGKYRILASLLGDDECEEDDFLEKEVFVRSTGIAEKPRGIEKFFDVFPVSKKLRFKYSVPEKTRVDIYSSDGRKIKTLDILGKGIKTLNVNPGVYFLRLKDLTKKVVVFR